ncbi:HAMP domain-containing histidine kinase [Candidatus Nomurabacteria bacterium]|nr:HAMP domain-containing histidine kinase [Candidatus Nomurabacteria bacterium]
MPSNIRSMFASATLKLTLWYLAVLMVISIIFSVTLYYVASSQIATRFDIFEARLQSNPAAIPSEFDFSAVRERQTAETKAALLIALFYANLIILTAGGMGSYYFARRTLEPIEDAHDAQARFTSDASHELRTPLAVMKSELEVLLRDKSATKSDLREVLESNLEEVNRLTDLSTVLLQLSRSEESKLEYTRADMHRILKNVPEKPDAPRFEYDLPKKPTYIYGNKPSLRELIHILYENALRYSPEKSKIVVSLKARRSYIQLKITNSGAGIEPKDLPHVFERFYRGNKSRSDEGYGLGLSLAKKIVDIHNGDIKITSNPNKETSVHIKLPK